MEVQPLPNDGMTAETAPGQNEENAQTSNGSKRSASSGRTQKFITSLHALEKGEDAQAENIAALFAENASLTNAALELAGRNVEGRTAIAAFWREYKATLGESYSEFSHVLENADAAGLFWTTNSKAVADYHGATLLQFNAEGEIEFFRGYYDTRELAIEK